MTSLFDVPGASLLDDMGMTATICRTCASCNDTFPLGVLTNINLIQFNPCNLINPTGGNLFRAACYVYVYETDNVFINFFFPFFDTDTDPVVKWLE